MLVVSENVQVFEQCEICLFQFLVRYSECVYVVCRCHIVQQCRRSHWTPLVSTRVVLRVFDLYVTCPHPQTTTQPQHHSNLNVPPPLDRPSIQLEWSADRRRDSLLVVAWWIVMVTHVLVVCIRQLFPVVNSNRHLFPHQRSQWHLTITRSVASLLR